MGSLFVIADCMPSSENYGSSAIPLWHIIFDLRSNACALLLFRPPTTGRHKSAVQAEEVAKGKESGGTWGHHCRDVAHFDVSYQCWR